MAKPRVADDLWAAVEPLLPQERPKPRGGRPRVPDRAALTGMTALTGPRDPAGARRALKAAGCRGERITLVQPTDFPSVTALNEVAADMLRRCGVNLDQQSMDFGTFIRRIAKQDAPERGGWNLTCISTAGASWVNRAAHNYLRGSGRRGIVGWAASERLE